MKKVIRNLIIIIIVLAVFFFGLPLLEREENTEGTAKILEMYGEKSAETIEDRNHIALFGTVMEFPLTVSNLPEELHIKDMYYEEMTDGIDAGDCFHCSLLNEDDEEVAYIRVSNLKQNTADSPDGMTITFMEASSFQKDGKEYAVPFELMGGIGIGSTYDEVKKVFPEASIEGTEDYSIVTLKEGILTITLEFTKQMVYKMAVEAY
ncbi:MAG: hypothetical protein ACI4A3_10820 [Lachnospiraceae bacterium]